MSSSFSAVPSYVKSKIDSLVVTISTILEMPRSFVNIISAFPSKIVLNVHSIKWQLSTYWYNGLKLLNITTLPLKVKSEDEEVRHQCETAQTHRLDVSSISKLYSYILERNFMEVTIKSLEILRYESKVLRGLQDFEILSTLKSIFGVVPEQTNKRIEKCKEGLLWKTWRAFLNMLSKYPLVSWLNAFDKLSVQNETSLARALPEPNNSVIEETKENDCKSFTSDVPSATSLLMCESGLIPTIVSDSGNYAFSTTHDLLKEAVLLFVPMELLINATEVLRDPSLVGSLSPMSALWKLFNYISIWGVDIVEDIVNQQDIDYAIIDDDDFHFVVNVPKLRRPILFIGLR